MRTFPTTRAWVFAGTLGLLAGMAQTASAAIYNFDCYTNNSATDCAILEAQATVDVTQTGDTGTFTFLNVVGQPMSITDVYITDGTILSGTFDITESSGVSFSEGASPGHPPGSDLKTWDFTADADAKGGGVASNGIDAASEWLTITASLFTGVNLLNAIDSGLVRIAIKTQAFASGGSEAGEVCLGDCEPTLIPVPAALPLFLTGLLGFGILGRRRRTMAEA